MELLTPLQINLLKEMGQTPLGSEFFLTGGTALSAFYLGHRYSLDLDFFTADPSAVARVPALMQNIAQNLAVEVTFTRTLDSFLECFLRSGNDERVEMDFVLESPFRLQPLEKHPELNILVDNLTDIACNKLAALFGRAEPKDFVDVYFLCQEHFSFDQLLELTRQKHLGVDDYWLAVALRRVARVELLPRMIKPVSLEELRAFFLDRAGGLMNQIDENLL